MSLNRENACCFTGHRQIPKREGLWLRRQLREEIYRLEAQGVWLFLAGGAVGFDTMAAQEVVRLRDTVLPGIGLILVLPGRGQEAHWQRGEQMEYRRLLQAADDAVYTGEGCRSAGDYLRRDRYMVDHSAHCVCYLDRGGAYRGGTAYTVRYARKRGLDIVNLAYGAGEAAGD